MEETKRKMIYLIIGIWVSMILISLPAGIAAVIFGKRMVPFFLGELLGSLAATGLICHIYYSLDIALDIGDRAKGYTIRAVFLRSAVTLAVLVLSVMFREIFYPPAVFLGLFGMKLSVYIQPIIIKIQNRKDVTL